MKYSFLILLATILIINSIFSKTFFVIINELFTSENPLSLKSLNTCGRQLYFPNQTTSNVLASTRASKSDIGNTDPRGVCGSMAITPSDSDTSSSVVVENSLYYTLKSVCMGLRFTSYNIDKDNNLYITFLHDTVSDRDNMSLLILLNPLYVEFMNKGGKMTMGYKLACETYDSSFNKKTNDFGNNSTFVYSPHYNKKFDKTYASHLNTQNNKHVITLKFIPIIDPNKTNCDTAFDYVGMGINLLNNDDLKNNNNVVNLNTYFLDDIPTSFQKPSRSMKLNYDLSQSQFGTSTIYWNDYSNDTSPLRSKKLSLNEKLFMNNLRIMYSNYIAPVLTFNIDINVSKSIIKNIKNNSMAFLMCYVDDGNEWLSCTSNNMSGGKNNNNIFSMNLQYKNDNFYYINITTSKNSPPDCNWNGADPDCLSIQLPYNDNNGSTRFIFTMSSQQKILYAQWFADGNKQYSIGKTINCTANTGYDICNLSTNTNTNTPNNNYNNIFINNQRPAGNVLQNIILAYNKQILKGLNNVHLGYENFYKIDTT